MMTNKVYDILKWITLIALPAISTFIITLGSLLGFDSTTAVGIIAAITTMLGAMLGISSAKYAKMENTESIETDKKEEVNPVK